MAFENGLPLLVPGYTNASQISPDIQELITDFNLNNKDALTRPNMKSVAWADKGTNTSVGLGKVKSVITLPSGADFVPFEIGGDREYNTLAVGEIEVILQPQQLNYRWPMLIDEFGRAMLTNAYGITNMPAYFIKGSRAKKAQMVANILYTSVTSAQYGLTATQLTLAQPNNPLGLPLFTNGTDSPLQYSNPKNPQSGRYQTFYPGVGDFGSYFQQSLSDMTQVPDPMLQNMNMGNMVTDIVGPTWMLIPFLNAAIQQLQFQAGVIGGTGVAAATTNATSIEALKAAANAGTFIGTTGLAPWTFWIAPQMDNHPFFTGANKGNLTAGPGGKQAHFWLSLSAAEGESQAWCQVGCNTKDFVPRVTLYGENDPKSQEMRMCRMLGDLDCASAPGLPHFAKMYLGCGQTIRNDTAPAGT